MGKVNFKGSYKNKKGKTRAVKLKSFGNGKKNKGGSVRIVTGRASNGKAFKMTEITVVRDTLSQIDEALSIKDGAIRKTKKIDNMTHVYDMMTNRGSRTVFVKSYKTPTTGKWRKIGISRTYSIMK